VPWKRRLFSKNWVIGDGLTMAGSGALFGRSKSWVSRRLKLLSVLEPSVLAEVGRGLFQPRLAQKLYRLPLGNGDQQRVLLLVLKHHLNKEELRELVDQWLDADEAGKSRLAAIFQKSGTCKGRYRGTPTSGAQLKRYVVQQLRQCTWLLDQLVEVVVTASLPAADWWPAPAYKIFLQNVGKLDAVVDPVGYTFAGGDWPFAPFARRTTGKEALKTRIVQKLLDLDRHDRSRAIDELSGKELKIPYSKKNSATRLPFTSGYGSTVPPLILERRSSLNRAGTAALSGN